MEMLYIVTAVWVMKLYIFVKIHWTVNLNHKFYLYINYSSINLIFKNDYYSSLNDQENGLS